MPKKAGMCLTRADRTECRMFLLVVNVSRGVRRGRGATKPDKTGEYFPRALRSLILTAIMTFNCRPNSFPTIPPRKIGTQTFSSSQGNLGERGPSSLQNRSYLLQELKTIRFKDCLVWQLRVRFQLIAPGRTSRCTARSKRRVL